MAKQFSFSSTAAALFFAAPVFAMLAGCQQSTLVDALPPPTLNGPDIVRPAASVALIPPLAPLAPFAPITSHVLKGTPRDWIPVAAARPWKWIVIHHSATSSGSAAIFDKMHREKGWDELGYHFVIGNGTQSGDGQVEVGPRWPIQKHGAHAKTPDNRYNDFGIGICLVGNFDITTPSPAQLRSLARLVAFLQERYHIPSDCVLRHKDTKPTDCPGRNLNIVQVREMASRILVDAGFPAPDGTAFASAAREPSADRAGSPSKNGSVATGDLLVELPDVR